MATISAQQFFKSATEPIKVVAPISLQSKIEETTPKSDTFLGLKQGQESYPAKVVEGLKQTFTTGAEQVKRDLVKTYKEQTKPGISKTDELLSAGQAAGNLAGSIAGTAGGIIGSFIAPLLPQVAKEKIGDIAQNIEQKVDEIPGMTPEIKQSLGNVFNAVSLLGGGKAGTAAVQEAKSGILRAGDIAKDLSKTAQSSIDDIATKVGTIGGEQASKIASKATEILATNPSDQVITILKETPTPKLQEYVKIAETASKEGRALTAFEKVGDMMGEATKQIEKQKSSLAQQKTAIINKAKVGLTEFKDAPRQALLKVMKLEQTPLTKEIISRLKSVKTKLDADKAIDFIQDKIYNATKTQTIASGSTLEKQLRGIVGELNGKLKESLPASYANLNAKVANRIGVLNKLSSSLGDVVEGVPLRGASLVKQYFSPSGRTAKELFDFIKKNTGVDLAQEVTLAKFASELFGDPKVRSLLEGLPTSRQGVVSKVIDIAAEKFGVAKKLQEVSRKGTIKKAEKFTK